MQWDRVWVCDFEIHGSMSVCYLKGNFSWLAGKSPGYRSMIYLTKPPASPSMRSGITKPSKIQWVAGFLVNRMCIIQGLHPLTSNQGLVHSTLFIILPLNLSQAVCQISGLQGAKRTFVPHGWPLDAHSENQFWRVRRMCLKILGPFKNKVDMSSQFAGESSIFSYFVHVALEIVNLSDLGDAFRDTYMTRYL